MLAEYPQSGSMWDSAKKPIKVRSVLQRNGMRHFVVNEESDEVYSNFLQQQKQRHANNSKTSSRPPVDGTDNSGTQKHQDRHGSFNNNGDDLRDKLSLLSVQPLHRSQTFSELDERRSSSENDGEFFGVAGSKICNSKMHKGQCSHHFHQFHQQPHGLAQFHKETMDTISKYPRLKPDLLDLVPVKSPVIKKLINGGLTTSNNKGSDDPLKHKFGPRGSHQPEGIPTTLCSRIMTWIDLEVKRNSGKGKMLGKLPITELNFVSDLTLPSCELTSMSPSSDSSSESTSSGEGINTSSSHSSSCNNSSSEISLPKLVPCWRKEKEGAVGSRIKKSVRISEDLPRWGKMRRRGRVKDRSVSLLELCDDRSAISSSQPHRTSDRNAGHQQKLKGTSINRKYHSTLDLTEPAALNMKEMPSWNAESWEDADEHETDNFFVCDEKFSTTSGKLQVHIFLPQTDSARASSAGSNNNLLSGRSEDSTS